MERGNTKGLPKSDFRNPYGCHEVAIRTFSLLRSIEMIVPEKPKTGYPKSPDKLCLILFVSRPTTSSIVNDRACCKSRLQWPLYTATGYDVHGMHACMHGHAKESLETQMLHEVPTQ
eukprot:1608439-Pleurochrysis_carterae.AAC.1